MTASTESRQSPLGAWSTRFASASADPARFSIRERPFLTQITIRGDATHAGYEQVLGTPLPQEANTWTSGRDCSVLWLGPDEWLVTADDTRRKTLLADLGRALEGSHFQVVDVSASRAVMEIAGADARAILAKGCSLDLRGAAFSAPHCAQSLLARAQMLLQALDDRPAFLLFVRNSFAHYVADWLLDAAAETGSSRGFDAERISARLA